MNLNDCLNYLSSNEARKEFKTGDKEKVYIYSGELLKLVLPQKRIVKVEEVVEIGGESVCLIGFCETTYRNNIFKIAFADANMRGQRIVYTDLNRVEYFNIVRERFIRGGGRIQAALSEIIPRHYGYIPFIRYACSDPVFLEMEYIEAQNPYEYLKSKDFRIVFEYFYKLIVFLEIVQSQYEVIHRDLKPNNLGLIEDHEGIKPVVFDWTFSKKKSDKEERNINEDDLTRIANLNFFIDSSIFSSPKLKQGKSDLANETDDLFSLGRIMYCLFSRNYPRKEEEINLDIMPEGSQKIYLNCCKENEKERYPKLSFLIQALEEFAYNINLDFNKINVPQVGRVELEKVIPEIIMDGTTQGSICNVDINAKGIGKDFIVNLLKVIENYNSKIVVNIKEN